MKINKSDFVFIEEVKNIYGMAWEKFQSMPSFLLPKQTFPEVDLQSGELIEDSGLVVNDPVTYAIYLIKIEEVLDTPYLSGPYWLHGEIAISTYEQFKLYLLRFNPWDFWDGETNKLTYLCHFVEEYLDQELASSGKKHLIDCLKQLEIDLNVYQEEFWNKIKDKLEIFTKATIDEIVAEKLENIKEFIDSSFKSQWQFLVYEPAYRAEVNAILKNLEIRLSEGSYKHLNNPNLFIQTSQNQTFPSESTDTTERLPLSLKSEIAENISEFGAHAEITKEQQNMHSERGEQLIKNTQEVFSISLLTWMDQVIQDNLNYEEILAKLQKHFKPIWIF